VFLDQPRRKSDVARQNGVHGLHARALPPGFEFSRRSLQSVKALREVWSRAATVVSRAVAYLDWSKPLAKRTLHCAVACEPLAAAIGGSDDVGEDGVPSCDLGFMEGMRRLSTPRPRSG
jgi:hypothetical protein